MVGSAIASPWLLLVLDGGQLEQFRDALVAAFPETNDFEQFAVFGKFITGIAADLGEGPLRDLAFKLLKQQEAAGNLGALLDAALKRRPGNPRLRAFAKSVGRAPIAAAHELLNKASFDLDDQEREWSKALVRPQRRLLILVLDAVDHELIDNLVGRLQAQLAAYDEAALEQKVITLRPTVTNVAEAIAKAAAWERLLTKKQVLCAVHADAATPEVVDRFLKGVREKYPGTLDHHLVLMVNAPGGCGWEGDLVRLPPPRFEEAHLYAWVERVSAGRGWTNHLKDRFKTWLYTEALYENALTGSFVYEALALAIEVLQPEPDEATLLEFLQARA